MTQQTPKTIDEAEAKIAQCASLINAFVTLHCIPLRYQGALEFCSTLASDALEEVRKLKAGQGIILPNNDDTHSIL